MAHFYGSLKGSRGEATRLGGKASGLTTYAASWAGAVRVTLYVNADGVDCALVHLTRHHGEGTERVLYDGPVAGQGTRTMPADWNAPKALQ